MIAEDAARFVSSPAGTLGLLYVSLTNMCNARCSYCDVHETMPRRGRHAPSDIVRVLDEARTLGCGIVHFMGGGEPLVSRDFLSAARACAERGMAVSMTTNGFHLAERVAALPADLELRSVLVSIDSHVADEHDAVRRVPGLRDRAIAGIGAVGEGFPGARIVLNHVMTAGNIDRAATFIAWAGTIGAHAVNLIAVKDNPQLTPSDAQVAAFVRDEGVRRRAAADAGVALLYDARDGEAWAAARTSGGDATDYRCRFPDHALYVDLPTGAVFPCDCTVHRKPEARFLLGNVWREGLAAAWRGDATADLRRILASPCDPGCKADCDWNNRRTNRVLIAATSGVAAEVAG